MRRINQLVTRFFNLVIKHNRFVIASVSILSIISIFPIISLKLSTRLDEILPQSNPQVQSMKKQLNDFKGGGAGYHILIESGNTQQVINTTNRFCDSVKSVLPNAIISRGQDTSFTNSFAFWMLSENMMSKLAESYKGPLPSQILEMINEILEQDISYETTKETSFSQNPIQTLRHFIEYLFIVTSNNISQQSVYKAIDNLFSGGSVKISADSKSGYFLIIDNSYNTNNQKENYQFAKELKNLALSMSNDNTKISVGGTIMLSYEESSTILKNLLAGSIGTFIAILLFLLIMYRDLKKIAILMITLLCSLLISTSVISVVSGGTINITTGAFLLLLTGMGIDFAVHFIPACQVSDVGTSMIRKMRSTIIAAFSTCLIFLFLLITDLPPLQELGWVVAVGLGITLVVSAIMIPALTKLFGLPLSNVKNSSGNIFILSKKWSYAIVIILCLSSLTGCYLLTRIEMVKDIKKLNAGALESNIAIDKILKNFDITPPSLTMIVNNRDSLRSIVDDLSDDPLIKRIESPLSIIPDSNEIMMFKNYFLKMKLHNHITPSNYTTFKKELIRFVSNIHDLSQIAYMDGKIKLYDFLQSELSATGRLYILDSLSKGNKLNKNTFFQFESLSSREMHQRIDRLTSGNSISFNNLPELIRNHYFPIDTNSRNCLVYIYTHRDTWNPKVYAKIKEHLISKFPTITGAPYLSNLIVETVVYRGSIALLSGIVACYFLLLFYFRNFKIALIGILPIFAGICHTGYIFFGGQHLQLPLYNYISVCSLTILSGIGLDYTVYALSISDHNQSTVSRSILISGITTILGFIGLATCSHTGLSGLGISLTMGLLICMIMSFLLIFIRKGR
jgi:predicted RND superfamily exporter protein